MKTAILVQARMNATRLPGKMMIQVGGKPILQHVVERLRLSTKIKNVLVLTSDEVSEDPIADWCRFHSIEFFRGPLEDVYGRFAEAVKFYNLDAFVRICADSPVIDAQVVDELVGVYNSGRYDLVTNVRPRTFPKGVSVEVINAKFFLTKECEVKDPEDREHVTAYFYRELSNARMINVANPLGDFSSKNLCVDTAEDLERFKLIHDYFNGAIGGCPWHECLAAAESGKPEQA